MLTGGTAGPTAIGLDKTWWTHRHPTVLGTNAGCS